MNDKPWINAYPPGVFWDAEIVPGPVQSILDDAVGKWPDRPAIDFVGKRFPYRDLGHVVNRAAKGLQQLGVKPGIHVGLYLPNSPHYIITFFGVLKAGGTLLNYSPLDAARVLEHKIEDSRTDFLITLDMASLYPQMAAMHGKTRLKKLVVGSLAELAADPDAVMTEMKASRQLSDVAWDDDRQISFAQLLHNDGDFQAYPVTDPVEMIAALKDISGKGVSVFCGVPTMFTALINHPETPKHSLRTLKYCGSGGAPLPLEVAQRFAAITGCNLTEGWGMTETSPAGTFTPAQKDGMRKAGSCGMPMPGIVIKFLRIDHPEQYVRLGERGEICIKGPNVMKGYWNNPQATAEVTTFDGFLRTGDVGYMDEDGFVFIVDRTKDMLLCSGFNVYPRVLEEAIYKHPAVELVAVIGIPA